MILSLSYILTLAVAVIGNRQFVASFLASAFLQSAQIFVAFAVRPADWTTTSWCLALRAAHTPWSSSAHHALFSLLTPYFRAAFYQEKQFNGLPLNLNFWEKIIADVYAKLNFYKRNNLRSYFEEESLDFFFKNRDKSKSKIKYSFTSARTTLHTSTKHPPKKETSAIEIFLRVRGRCCGVRRATIFLCHSL